MLGKLIKHEFAAVSRFLLPLHLALILITIIGRIYVQFAMHTDWNSPFMLVHISLAFFYGLALAAVMILTYVYLYILRPHRNLFSDEGYLMHTLPVSPAMHIWSKLLVAVCWILIDLILIALSMFLMMINPDVLESLPAFFNELQDIIPVLTGMDQILGAIITLIDMLLSTISGILIVYMCMAIGHSVNQYKLLLSIVIYLGVRFVISIVSSIFSVFIGWGDSNSLTYSFMIGTTAMGGQSAKVWFDTILNLVLAIGAFFVTQYFLQKRLNLE